MNKEQKFAEIKDRLLEWGFEIESLDTNRPWGGFFVIKETNAPSFIDKFFPGTDKTTGKISPKVLLVEPNKKLSWQYHHRRSEKWIVIDGSADIVRSNTDTETPPQRLNTGDAVTLEKGERHRLIGLEHWAVIAEIWIHTDPSNPSNEDDIIRLHDDFGR